MNPAKVTEPIVILYGMLNQVGQGTIYYMGCRCPHRKGHFWGIWVIEKHCKAKDFARAG